MIMRQLCIYNRYNILLQCTCTGVLNMQRSKVMSVTDIVSKRLNQVCLVPLAQRINEYIQPLARHYSLYRMLCHANTVVCDSALQQHRLSMRLAKLRVGHGPQALHLSIVDLISSSAPYCCRTYPGVCFWHHR